MATKTDGDVLRKKEKVVAARSMPGIPEGTAGKVFMVSGFEWIRYWVRFDNGQVRGSIRRNQLARLAEWDEIQARRARGEDEPGAAADGADAAAGDGDGGSAASSSGEGIVHDGVLVPQHLLDRSKNRRAALGA